MTDTQDFSNLRALTIESERLASWINTYYDPHDAPKEILSAPVLLRLQSTALESLQTEMEQLRLKLLFNADAAKDREQAEKYLRQAENLLTSDERTLHAEVARLREKESSLDRLLALFKEVQAVADERDAARARLAEIEAGASPEPSALQAENAKLITALAACRDAFPVPDAGSRLDDWYCTAMAEPLAVPEYVNACVGASPVQPSQAGGGYTWGKGKPITQEDPEAINAKGDK